MNKRWLAITWILLFAFQDALAEVSSIFSYIDELPVILLTVDVIVRTIDSGRIKVRYPNIYSIAITLFVITGLAGNAIYRYQPVGLVITDLVANVKFWCAIVYFTTLFEESDLASAHIPNTAKCVSEILLALFLLDRIVNIFPAEYRHGIKSAVLFYSHPTYLAGVCAFLIAVMTLYDVRKYGLFILIDLMLLSFTLRSKAIVSAIVYVMLYVVIQRLHWQLKVWQIAAVGLVSIACAWSQIYFYFIQLAGHSARSVMTMTSLQIMKDYFPIGTGFGTYASHSAAVNYSPVYIKYGFRAVDELSDLSTTGTFFDDQFWPIIFGQTGVLGTISYVCLLYLLFRRIQELYRVNLSSYMTALFILIYLLIASVAEPAFNNSVAIPLAMGLAIAMKRTSINK